MSLRSTLSQLAQFAIRVAQIRSVRAFTASIVGLGILFSVLKWLTPPPAHMNSVVWVLVGLVISAGCAHWLAECVDSAQGRWILFWKIVDYPWVLAAFGTLLISTAKYDLDAARQRVTSAEQGLTETGARLDRRCADALAIVAEAGQQAGRIVRQSVQDCVALKLPMLVRTDDVKELNAVLDNLERDEHRSDSVARIAPLMVISAYLQPVEPKSRSLKDASCQQFMRREHLPNPLIFSGVTEGLSKLVAEDFAGRLYSPAVPGHPYWRPSAYALAVERAFATDEILFCGNLQILEQTQKDLEHKRKLWGFVTLLTDHVPIWYITLAVFAGLRLGKTAFEIRPKTIPIR